MKKQFTSFVRNILKSKEGRNFLIIVAFLLVFIPFSSYLRSPQTGNDCNAIESIQARSDWYVESYLGVQPTIDVQWQRTLIGQDTPLAIGGDTLVFFQGVVGCQNDEHIVALDVDRGEIVWTHAASNINSIDRIEDGYLYIECCTTLFRLNDGGEVVWRSNELPIRLFRATITIANDRLYLPTPFRIYVLDFNDGQIIETIDIENAIAAYDDFAFVNFAGDFANLIELDGFQRKWSIRLPLRVYRQDDILIAVYARSRMTAVDIHSGELLWEIEQNFNALPILMDHYIITSNEDNLIQWHDIQTGEAIAEVGLRRSTQHEPVEQYSIPVTLAANEGHLIVLFNNLEEVISLDYQLND